MQLKALIFAALALTISTAAEAVPLRFELNSTCLSNCDQVGLNTGDAVGGFVVLDSTTFSNGYDSSGNPSTLLDFEMTFGTISLDFSSAAGALFFTLRGGATSADRLSRWVFVATAAIAPDLGDGFGIHGGPIAFTTLFADDQTNCSSDCRIFPGSGAINLANFGTITGVTQIPLPASAWLLLGGVAALGVRGRRARA
ncbi:MAG: VPLPA-CTERM sorting domain-containing protein [Pseudomonadota bacterium]